jgi:hypothetical protein
MVIPRLRLVQAQSAFSDTVGALHNSLTGEAKKEVRSVVLRVGKARIMWPENFQRDQDPLCASDDAVTPRPNFASVFAQQCTGCVKAEWQGDEPPACALAYTYLLCDRDADDLPALLTATRTSLKAAKQVNTLVRAFGVRREVIVSGQQTINDKGKFYTLTFRLGNGIEPDDVARYAAMARALSGVVLSADTGEDLKGDEPF